MLLAKPPKTLRIAEKLRLNPGSCRLNLMKARWMGFWGLTGMRRAAQHGKAWKWATG
jgi:hypothetical protein